MEMLWKQEEEELVHGNLFGAYDISAPRWGGSMVELTKSWVLSLPNTVKRRGQGEMKSLARPCTSH